MGMQEAVQAFQLAEQGFGERMEARGFLFDPALGVEAGLLAALPHLERIKVDEGAVPVADDEALHRMNGLLCTFGMSWELDGDYLRCRKCKRPQIASCVDKAFPHTDECKAAGEVEKHPWLTLLNLLRPLYLHPPAQAAQVDREDARAAAFEIAEAALRRVNARSSVSNDGLLAIVDRYLPPTAEPATRCDKPGCNCAAWKPEGCAWDGAEPVAQGDAVLVSRAELSNMRAFLMGNSPVPLSGITAWGEAIDRWLAAQPRAVPLPDEVINRAIFTTIVSCMESDNGCEFTIERGDFSRVNEAITALRAVGFFAANPNDLDGDYWFAAGAHDEDDSTAHFSRSADHYAVLSGVLNEIFDRPPPEATNDHRAVPAERVVDVATIAAAERGLWKRAAANVDIYNGAWVELVREVEKLRTTAPSPGESA